VPRKKIGELVDELEERGSYFFVTDLETDYYSGFGKGWMGFVEAMGRGGARVVKRREDDRAWRAE
jgi:hypothetical protein